MPEKDDGAVPRDVLMNSANHGWGREDVRALRARDAGWRPRLVSAIGAEPTFWLIVDGHAILGRFHRRPSVTE